MRNHVYQARIARREDWEMGPLAPRRDTPSVDSDDTHWGSLSQEVGNHLAVLTEEMREARAAWCGGPKLLCIKVGDRIVFTEGPYKGRIATVGQIERDTLTVEVREQEFTYNVSMPAHYIAGDPVVQMPVVQPISSVRLVHPMPDPKTGKIRDVVIRELKPVHVHFDRPTRSLSFKRIVPGLNVIIPWPKKPEVKKTEHEWDTARADVEERTHVPTLLRPPMPETVIDELRNRYSIFRTRHTPEYIAQKEAEEAEKQARKKSTESMLLPVQEYNRKLREQRRALGQPVLTEEMLAKIGQVIEKTRQQRASGQNTEVDRVASIAEKLSIQAEAADAAAEAAEAAEEEQSRL